MQCRAWRSDEVGGENKDLAWRIRGGPRGGQLCEAEQRRGLIGVRYVTQNVLDERMLRQESNLRPVVAGLRSGKHSLHADFISCHPADGHTFCNPKLNKHMKKSVLSLITVLIGIAFIASCAPQQGTTATSTTAAATKSPSPSPKKKKATTKKKKAPETEASPSPAEGAASPSPTP
jgi:hypothetical protein